MDFVTLTEASRILGISKRRIYQLIVDGRIKKYKRLGKSLLLKEDVLNLLTPISVSETQS